MAIDKNAIKDMTKEGIVAAIKNRTIDPQDDEDFKLLASVSETEVGSEERKSLIGDASIPPMNEEVKGDEESNIVEFPKSGEVPPVADSKPSETEEDPYLGYGSIEELKASHKKIREDFEAMNRKHRDTNGRLGNELKKYKDEIEKYRSAPAIVEGNTDVSDVARPSLPVAPEIPVATDYEDGQYDDKYKADMAKYKADYIIYKDSVAKYDELNEKYVAGRAKRIAESELEQFRPMREEAEQQRKNTVVNERWGEFWNSAEAIQSDYGLKTSVPLKTINEHVLIINNPSGFSPDVVDGSNAFIASLSPKDIESFNKLAPVLEGFYEFDDGLPVKPKHKKFRSYLIENDLEDSFVPVNGRAVDPKRQEVEALSKRQMQSMNTATTITDSATMSDNTTNTIDTMSHDELVVEFNRMAKAIQKNPALLRDSAMKSRWDTVSAKVGAA